MTGIIIPLYTYPTSQTWYDVIDQKQLHPSVLMVAVINPNNGVGPSSNIDYLNGIRALQTVGVLVLGYVATGYGKRTAANALLECQSYALWYGVDGIFFDEYQSDWIPPSVPGVLIGNPGIRATGPIPLITYENASMPPPGFTGNYIAHTVPELPATFPRPDWLYITDDPATYQRLPSYFAAEMAALDSGTPTLPPSVSAGTLKITTPDGKTYTWPVSVS